jgi:hypothetical protein
MTCAPRVLTLVMLVALGCGSKSPAPTGLLYSFPDCMYSCDPSYIMVLNQCQSGCNGLATNGAIADCNAQCLMSTEAAYPGCTHCCTACQAPYKMAIAPCQPQDVRCQLIAQTLYTQCARACRP